ncbi:hypothetical protein FBY51_0531 [Zymomonas mobilis]|uniref:hypothetical protein n=1 Tax=Zymomonas mobilis TaxID=542 RepID=UPI00026D88CE|nr:hypothetical protein [Zymomonas mobilis]AFN56751.1 hypothetical protein ZZ6_0857 [Zymomonas mobilis subsp. mobilis ATCC 29191]TQK77818.1 hypothetical protein FBY53_0459 [Zymomonas mobilis]TQL15535.1 hypothetical protein FBY51_0531 [Zymomonas mobilis]GEB87104.1 hypothetical protein ZMO01_04440 [Zymomonas mobilis subsp. mobilis]
MSFSDWSQNADSNSNIGGISIAEGCPPGNLNNALREIMAEMRSAINQAMDTALSSADIASFRQAIGALANSGDTIDGVLRRKGQGVFPYFADGSFSGGRIYVTNSQAADPTSQPGDIWLVYV